MAEINSSSKKGQMFIIASVIVLIGLIMLRDIVGSYTTVEEKRFQESLILDKHLRNINNEYEHIIAVSSLHDLVNETAITNLENFTNFLNNDNYVRILYAYVFVNKTANEYYLTLGNYLGDIINMTVNATSSTPANWFIGDFNNTQNVTLAFASSLTTGGAMTINLTYELKGRLTKEIIPVLIPALQDKVEGFFDITLYTKDAYVRSKDIYNQTFS